MAEQVFYEIARWRLDEQIAEIRELNSRLMVAFSGATALLVIFGALQGLEDIGRQQHRDWTGVVCCRCLCGIAADRPGWLSHSGCRRTITE